MTIDESKETMKQSEATEAVMTPSTESPGLSLLTKLIFFGVIIGAILGFLRTRKPGSAEKSLA